MTEVFSWACLALGSWQMAYLTGVAWAARQQRLADAAERVRIDQERAWSRESLAWCPIRKSVLSQMDDVLLSSPRGSAQELLVPSDVWPMYISEMRAATGGGLFELTYAGVPVIRADVSTARAVVAQGVANG
jgi:hypothetical protein